MGRLRDKDSPREKLLRKILAAEEAQIRKEGEVGAIMKAFEACREIVRAGFGAPYLEA
jgi:hypothetical protein